MFCRAAWSLAGLQKFNDGGLYGKQRVSLRSWADFFNTNQFKAPANVKAGEEKNEYYSDDDRLFRSSSTGFKC